MDALPVRLIEPFGAGGGPDLVAQVLAGPLSQCWGRPVQVENHPGAGSTAAPALVAKAPADGGTLLINTSAHAYSAAATADLPYDPLRDFAPIAPLTSQSYVLVAGRNLQVRGLAELIVLSKERGLSFGSTGIGTGTHIGTEELNRAVGIAAVHIPAGPADAITDVVAKVVNGEIDYAMSPVSVAAPHIEVGDLDAIGLTSAQESPALPGVPPLAQGGVLSYDFPIWYGVWAPADTPIAIVERLARDIATAMSGQDARDWLLAHGMTPMNMSRESFAQFVVDEMRRAARILDAAATRPAG
jgi:tripartite-type tricarboxylate transporter receptor subunit TctC